MIRLQPITTGITLAVAVPMCSLTVPSTSGRSYLDCLLLKAALMVSSLPSLHMVMSIVGSCVLSISNNEVWLETLLSTLTFWPLSLRAVLVAFLHILRHRITASWAWLTSVLETLVCLPCCVTPFVDCGESGCLIIEFVWIFIALMSFAPDSNLVPLFIQRAVLTLFVTGVLDDCRQYSPSVFRATRLRLVSTLCCS